MELLVVLITGAVVALAVQFGKHICLPVPPKNRKKFFRAIVVVVALVLAYLALRDQADVTVQAVLTYAAGVVASAEAVYRWFIKQVVPE